MLLGLSACTQKYSSPYRHPTPEVEDLAEEVEGATRLPAIPHYSVRRAVGAIKIDGSLGEKSWDEAEDVGQFYTFDGQNVPGQPVTCKIIYDEEALYVGWFVQDDNIIATLTERDAHLWNEDVVEIFLDPSAELYHYYEIIVNPLNTIFDAYQITNEDRSWVETPDWSWTAEGMETAVRVNGTITSPQAPPTNDSSWSVEMKLPWSLFAKHGVTKMPEPGTVWRAALTRYDGRDQREPDHIHLAWSPPYQLANPHRLDYMGYLHFSSVFVGWEKPPARQP